MPTISMFYGILIAILYEDSDRHHLPHIHVRYQETKASISINDGEIYWLEIFHQNKEN